MRKFKRSTNFIVTTILLAIVFFYLIKMVQVGYAEGNLFGDTVTPTDVKLLIRCLFFTIVWAIALVTVPPDFKYFINIANDCIIFEMSEEDHRRIDKNFIIASKKIHYIILDDGFSRIRIAYNKEVLQFLNEINN